MKATTQRDALKRSEKKAAERQPENFKDEATEDKRVEIGPDPTNAPIHGIDPPQSAPPERLGDTDARAKASRGEQR